MIKPFLFYLIALLFFRGCYARRKQLRFQIYGSAASAANAISKLSSITGPSLPSSIIRSHQLH
jgi:hypothetical protein